MNAGALANLNHEEIIDRIAGGEYAAHIAPTLGVTKQALHYHISKHPRYQEAREIGCALRIDAAMHEFDALQIPRPPLKPLDGTPEQLEQWKQDYQTWKDGLRASGFDLARAEAQFKAITWQAEREFPHRWGRTVEVTDNRADLGERLRRSKERVIDSTATVVEDKQHPAAQQRE